MRGFGVQHYYPSPFVYSKNERDASMKTISNTDICC